MEAYFYKSSNFNNGAASQVKMFFIELLLFLNLSSDLETEACTGKYIFRVNKEKESESTTTTSRLCTYIHEIIVLAVCCIDHCMSQEDAANRTRCSSLGSH